MNNERAVENGAGRREQAGQDWERVGARNVRGSRAHQSTRPSTDYTQHSTGRHHVNTLHARYVPLALAVSAKESASTYNVQNIVRSSCVDRRVDHYLVFYLETYRILEDTFKFLVGCMF